MNEKDLISELKLFWCDLAFLYAGDGSIIEECWLEIQRDYCNPERTYHNLNHVRQLIILLKKHRASIINFEALLFAAFYHDIIYEVTRDDNEIQSARLAEKRLAELYVDADVADTAVMAIRQTASHAKTGIFDIDLFLDFDRFILSVNENMYIEYTQQLRSEYAIFSDSIYTSVRIKTIEKCLKQPELYYTAIMKKREKDARQNLLKELQGLQELKKNV